MEHYLKREDLWLKTKEDEKADAKALATIVLTVDEFNIGYVTDKMSAREAWRALQGVYQRESAGSMLSLTKKL